MRHGLLVREPHLLQRSFADGSLVLNLSSNRLHQLNAVGGYILDQLQSAAYEDVIAARVVKQFEAGDEQPEVAADVGEFLTQALAHGLVRDAASNPAARGRLVVDAWRDELDAFGGAHQIPVWGKIEVSTRCHLDCVHCYIPGAERSVTLPDTQRHQGRQEMTDDDVCSVIDQLARLGTLLLTFTGGEIFIRRGMEELLRYAHERQFVLELFTSGTPLTATRIAALAELNIGRIQVSVYSHDSLIHDSVTGLRGSWIRSTTAVREMVRAGLHVDLACSLMPSNHEDALRVRDLAESLGATCSYGYPISARTDGNSDTHRLRLQPKQLDRAVRLLPAFFALPETKAADERICPAGVSMCAVTATGDVLPCGQFGMALGNVREAPLRTIWETSPKLRWLRSLRMGDLRDGAKAYVGLCPGLNLLEAGDPLKPASVTRDTTAAVHRVLRSRALGDDVRHALTSPGASRMRPES